MLTRSWASTRTLTSPVKKPTPPVRFSNATSAIAAARLRKPSVKQVYVRPIAEYAAVAWDPNTQRNIRKIEQIQRSSARYVTNTYDRRLSITALLSELQWPSLQERRRQSRLAMLFRIRFNLVDINWKDHLSESTSTTRGHTHSCRFMNPHCSSQAYNSSFFTRTSREWNTLKMDPSDFQTLDAFKSALRGATI